MKDMKVSVQALMSFMFLVTERSMSDAKKLKALVPIYLWFAMAFTVAVGAQGPVARGDITATLVSGVNPNGIEVSVKNLSQQPIRISRQIVALTPLRIEYLAKNPLSTDGVIYVFMTLVPIAGRPMQWNETPMGGVAMVPQSIGGGETALVKLQFTHGAQALVKESQGIKLSFDINGVEVLKTLLEKESGTWMERDR